MARHPRGLITVPCRNLPAHSGYQLWPQNKDQQRRQHCRITSELPLQCRDSDMLTICYKNLSVVHRSTEPRREPCRTSAKLDFVLEASGNEH